MDSPTHTPAQTAANPALEARPPTPATATTRRGLATASFSLGLWGTLVFWWYPFGSVIAFVGLLLGLGTLAAGIRAGKDGEDLALGGVLLGSTGVGFGVASYRFMQIAFEGGTSFPFYNVTF